MYGGWCNIEICALRPIVPRAIDTASASEVAVSQPSSSGTVVLSLPTTITREHCGKVIVVGSDNSTVPKLLGWERAETLAEAIAMGRSHMGRSAQITMLHHPPILMTDVR